MGTQKQSNTVTNKVNKVNSNVVKITVNQTKPQITKVKRLLSKYIIKNGINHINHTSTKPQIKKGTPQKHINQLQTIITNCLKNVIPTNYPHTPKPQLTFIKNNLNNHTVKYLQ
jgi:hypothetical protein